jgi:hypothetical protein
MSERHDDLSTADLAEQRPRDTERADDRVDDAGLQARQHQDPAHDDLSTRDDLKMRDDAVADEHAPGMGEHEHAAGMGAVREPEGKAAARPAALDGGTAATEVGPLLASQQAERFRARWTDVQTGFVDAPRQAVEQADGLVAELMQHLAKSFADERSGLESQWDRGGDVSTDDLRTAFQRYRSFFERLLAT